jgi:hypothetical protein
LKGSTSLAFIVLIASLWGVGFFGIIFSTGDIEETVNYQTGDFNTIAETKLKADGFERRTVLELNYSANIQALELGENGGGADWDDNIPTYSDLKSEYSSSIATHLDSQTDVIGCSAPGIESVEVEKNSSRVNATVSEPWVSCSAESANGRIPTETSINVSDNYSTVNPNNSYLMLANYSQILADEGKNISDERLPVNPNATGQADRCGHREDFYDEEDAKQDARGAARSNLISKDSYSSIASDAWSATSAIRPIPIIKKKVNTYWPDTEKLAHFEHLDTDIQDDACSYDPCDSDEDCDPAYSDRYIYEYRYDPEWVGLQYDYHDKNTIKNATWETEKINFNFMYRHGLE